MLIFLGITIYAPFQSVAKLFPLEQLHMGLEDPQSEWRSIAGTIIELLYMDIYIYIYIIYYIILYFIILYIYIYYYIIYIIYNI